MERLAQLVGSGLGRRVGVALLASCAADRQQCDNDRNLFRSATKHRALSVGVAALGRAAAIPAALRAAAAVATRRALARRRVGRLAAGPPAAALVVPCAAQNAFMSVCSWRTFSSLCHHGGKCRRHFRAGGDRLRTKPFPRSVVRIPRLRRPRRHRCPPRILPRGPSCSVGSAWCAAAVGR